VHSLELGPAMNGSPVILDLCMLLMMTLCLLAREPLWRNFTIQRQQFPPSIGGGNGVAHRGHVDPRVPRSHVERPSRRPLVFERPHSVATLRADEVSLLAEPAVSRPVPTRPREGDSAFRPASRDSRVSQGSRTSRVSRLSEHIGAIGPVVTGVVQDLLAA